MEERRQTHRYRVDWPLTLVFSDTGHSLRVRGFDLSVSGISLISPERVEPGTACRLKFRIKPEPRDLGVEIQPWGEVVHAEPGDSGHRIGIAFSGLGLMEEGMIRGYLEHVLTGK
ncbi:MAG: PilZ domain-containing protein [Ectothiorhodospiraceae bacterium]|nr:PilZ domain-containing protein [Ectothiorhodospiraceae bacterium]